MCVHTHSTIKREKVVQTYYPYCMPTCSAAMLVLSRVNFVWSCFEHVPTQQGGPLQEPTSTVLKTAGTKSLSVLQLFYFEPLQ